MATSVDVWTCGQGGGGGPGPRAEVGPTTCLRVSCPLAQAPHTPFLPVGEGMRGGLLGEQEQSPGTRGGYRAQRVSLHSTRSGRRSIAPGGQGGPGRLGTSPGQGTEGPRTSQRRGSGPRCPRPGCMPVTLRRPPPSPRGLHKGDGGAPSGSRLSWAGPWALLTLERPTVDLKHKHTRVSDNCPAPGFPPTFGGAERQICSVLGGAGPRGHGHGGSGGDAFLQFSAGLGVSFSCGCQVKSLNSTANASAASFPARELSL